MAGNDCESQMFANVPEGFVKLLSFIIQVAMGPSVCPVFTLYPHKLGKIHRRACLRLIPFPGTGDVLLAPTMISHPLAYVAPNPRHLAPTVGPGPPPSGDLF